jgi:hypothetical protein
MLVAHVLHKLPGSGQVEAVLWEAPSSHDAAICGGDSSELVASHAMRHAKGEYIRTTKFDAEVTSGRGVMGGV